MYGLFCSPQGLGLLSSALRQLNAREIVARSIKDIKAEMLRDIKEWGSFSETWSTGVNTRRLLRGSSYVKAAQQLETENPGKYRVVCEIRRYHDRPVHRGGKHVAWGGNETVREVRVMENKDWLYSYPTRQLDNLC
jgi:hypothetical protein|tara:strand:+ start:4451 stop:4858 length:408 start_codon:yes stop_codon:yes gene_type:complete